MVHANFGLRRPFASNFMPPPWVWPKNSYIYPLDFIPWQTEEEMENIEIDSLQATIGGRLKGEPLS
jgi:hypothetical protein